MAAYDQKELEQWKNGLLGKKSGGSNKKILTTYRGSAGWIEKGGIIRPGNVVWALTPKGVD